MSLLEQLGQQEIPRPPRQLRQAVRERVNTSLVLVQLLDLALRGLPYALLQFAKAVAGALLFTASGQYQPKPRDDARKSP